MVEATLVEKAARFSPDQLRRIARRAIEAVEPDQKIVDAHENELIRTEEQAAREKCSLTLHDNGDGTTTGHFTIPALAAAMLGKVIDAMTAPRRMRERTRRPDRSFDWRHRRGLAFAELLEHLPTDHLHPRPRPPWSSPSTTPSWPAPSRQPTSTPTRPSPPAKPAASPAPPASSRPSSDPSQSRSTSAARADCSPRPNDGQRTRTHHLRRQRMRTPLRLVRAPPPTTLGQRRPHRPGQRHPALLTSTITGSTTPASTTRPCPTAASGSAGVSDHHLRA